MKTKALLLTAAVAAAGVASSMAQVYSVNTVGYVNVVLKGAGAFTMIANPLDNTGTNNLTGLLGGPGVGVPNGTSVSKWNGTTFTGATKGTFSGAWDNNLAVPVGDGLFVRTPNSSGDVTNTFVGTVIPNSGGTNSVSLGNGLYVQVGSTLPVSGDLTSPGSQGPGTLNLGNTLPNGSQILTWDNSAAGTYRASTKGTFSGVWDLNQTLAVGQGFFIKPGGTTGSTPWVQSLP